MYKLSSKLRESMYRYKLRYILASRSLNMDRGIHVLAERSERGKHESKSHAMWRFLGKKISEAPR